MVPPGRPGPSRNQAPGSASLHGLAHVRSLPRPKPLAWSSWCQLSAVFLLLAPCKSQDRGHLLWLPATSPCVSPAPAHSAAPLRVTGPVTSLPPTPPPGLRSQMHLACFCPCTFLHVPGTLARSCAPRSQADPLRPVSPRQPGYYFLKNSYPVLSLLKAL